MQLAIHNWMRAESLESTLKRISALGYTHLEIQGAPEQYDTQEVKSLLEIIWTIVWPALLNACPIALATLPEPAMLIFNEISAIFT